MKEFKNWYYYVSSEGKSWPSFGRYDTENEHIAAKEAWKEALEWALSQQEQIDWSLSEVFAIQPECIEEELKETENEYIRK